MVCLSRPAKVNSMTQFPETSTHLGLPYLQPAQAQKHVTHNEALVMLDRLVQLAVQSATQANPPALVPDGARYLVPVGATGDWAGQDGKIAVREGTDWVFLAPGPGWLALVLDTARLLHFDGAGWTLPDVMAEQVARLGIATSADTVNRLAVAGAATLLTHDGAGHQLKVNKAQPGDTASLLFQSGWSGRAEIGLAGQDDLSLKVSADGATWRDGLRVAGATGQVTMDHGLHLDGPLTGGAVTQSALDATAGRVLRTGDSATLLSASPALRFATSGGPDALVVTTGAGFAAPPPGFALRFRAGAPNTGAATLALDGGAPLPCVTATGAALPAGYIRTDRDTQAVCDGAAWILSRAPERLSGPAGDALRLECGTMLAHATRSTVGVAGPTDWGFPAAFALPPVVTATALDGGGSLASLAAVGTTGCSFEARTLAGARLDGATVMLAAAGQWY